MRISEITRSTASLSISANAACPPSATCTWKPWVRNRRRKDDKIFGSSSTHRIVGSLASVLSVAVRVSVMLGYLHGWRVRTAA